MRSRTSIQAGDVHIEVADDGPGIPSAQRDAIFEKYTQVTDSSALNTGTNRGLGLTFAKLAAQALGGRITVECPPTGGTIFRMTLPLGVSQ